MSFLSTFAVNFGRVATLIQVLFYLPLALDIAGQDAFLALSASLASYYLFLSTVRLVTRNTRLAWIGQTLAVFQFVVIPACLLVCCNVYSPPSATIFPPRTSGIQDKSASEVISNLFTKKGLNPESIEESHWQSLTGSELLDRCVSASITFFFWLARRVPGWWHTLLRVSSPFFSLLEGVASLLVIQSLASTSRWIIASSLTTPSPRYQPSGLVDPMPTSRSSRTARWISNTFLMRSLASIGFGASEVWQIFFLLVSATIYVTAAFALYVSFDGATKDRPGTAAAIATSVTSTVWLTAIAFAIRKGNVIETSLMFAYVVFNIYQLGPSLSFTPDPITLIRSFKVNTHGTSFVDSLPTSLQAPLPSKILQAVGGLVEVIAHWLGQSLDFLSAAGAALPKSVIVSLIYRLMVLYAASRILPMLKGSVARKVRPHDHHHRRSSWGKARSAKTGIKEGEEEDEAEDSDWSSSSSSSISGSEIEELEEEVWDDEEGKWILQRRRLRRRRRRRTPFDEEVESESDEEGPGEEDREEDELTEDDDSGIAYNEDLDRDVRKKNSTKASAATEVEAEGDEEGERENELSLADRLKSPPPIEASLATPSRRRRKGSVQRQRQSKGASAVVNALDQGRSESQAGPAPVLGGPRKRPNLSRPPSERIHKRPKASKRRSSRRSRGLSSKDGTDQRDEDEGDTEIEVFGSFISFLVSYSRLILIAVYSHLLLLDQKNQVYWRFLTVGLTLFLWGLEIVISKEEEEVAIISSGVVGSGAVGGSG